MKQVFCYYLFHPWIVFLVGRMNKMIALLILRNVCHHPNIYQGFSTNIYDMDMFTTVELFFIIEKWWVATYVPCWMLIFYVLCMKYSRLDWSGERPPLHPRLELHVLNLEPQAVPVHEESVNVCGGGCVSWLLGWLQARYTGSVYSSPPSWPATSSVTPLLSPRLPLFTRQT